MEQQPAAKKQRIDLEDASQIMRVHIRCLGAPIDAKISNQNLLHLSSFPHHVVNGEFTVDARKSLHLKILVKTWQDGASVPAEASRLFGGPLKLCLSVVPEERDDMVIVSNVFPNKSTSFLQAKTSEIFADAKEKDASNSFVYASAGDDGLAFFNFRCVVLNNAVQNRAPKARWRFRVTIADPRLQRRDVCWLSAPFRIKSQVRDR